MKSSFSRFPANSIPCFQLSPSKNSVQLFWFWKEKGLRHHWRAKELSEIEKERQAVVDHHNSVLIHLGKQNIGISGGEMWTGVDELWASNRSCMRCAFDSERWKLSLVFFSFNSCFFFYAFFFSKVYMGLDLEFYALCFFCFPQISYGRWAFSWVWLIDCYWILMWV